MGEDDPWRSADASGCRAALFPRHPYRRPVIGLPGHAQGARGRRHARLLRALLPPGQRGARRVRRHRARDAALAPCGGTSASIPARPPRRSRRLPAGARAEPPASSALTMTLGRPGRAPVHRPGRRRASAATRTTRSTWSRRCSPAGACSRLHRGGCARARPRDEHLDAQRRARRDAASFWLLRRVRAGRRAGGARSARSTRSSSACATSSCPPSSSSARRRSCRGRSVRERDGRRTWPRRSASSRPTRDWRLALLDVIERIRAVDARRVRDVAQRCSRERRVVGWCLRREGRRPRSGARAPPATRRGARAEAGSPGMRSRATSPTSASAAAVLPAAHFRSSASSSPAARCCWSRAGRARR